MASKDSEELGINERYPLGDYSFRIERSSVPGSTNDKIEAICTDKDGKNARKSIQIPSSTKIEGWYVEANETEATVYIITKENVPDVPYDAINSASTGGGVYQGVPYTVYFSSGTGLITHTPQNFRGIYASTASGAVISQSQSQGPPRNFPLNSTITYAGKTAYYTETYAASGHQSSYPMSSGILDNYSSADIAWTMMYGAEDIDGQDKMVGRFAIDIEDAGGVGPGSDWTDPGDYDPDWEEGDPTHTLYATVTGALSGRHNDPIVDPSYSYIPSDKDTVKDYGCGGDGGHGGGGGAGASTVVVHKFATNQANSKEVTAIARRHGYGSGGGKGGKGGDGCILVYY